MPDRTLGQAAYEAFVKSYGREQWDKWARLDARQRVAWELAAAAVLEACGG